VCEEGHTEACASCATDAKELGSILKLLDEWHTPELSPYFDTRLRARLRAEAEAPKSLSEVLRSFGLHWRIAPVGVLATCIIFYIFFRTHPSAGSKQLTDEASAVVDLQSLDRDADLLSAINYLETGNTDADRE